MTFLFSYEFEQVLFYTKYLEIYVTIHKTHEMIQ